MTEFFCANGKKRTVTEMYEELVKRLREEAEPCEKSGCKQTANEMREAADAIENLQDALSWKEHFDLLAEQDCKQTPKVRGVIVSANHGITYVGYDETKPQQPKEKT